MFSKHVHLIFIWKLLSTKATRLILFDTHSIAYIRWLFSIVYYYYYYNCQYIQRQILHKIFKTKFCLLLFLLFFFVIEIFMLMNEWPRHAVGSIAYNKSSFKFSARPPRIRIANDATSFLIHSFRLRIIRGHLDCWKRI